MYVTSYKSVGGPLVPHDIQVLRRNSVEMMRRMGQPCVHRHRFNLEDLRDGFTLDLPDIHEEIAVKRCPACFDGDYEQTRADCPVCYGVGLCSVEDAEGQWINSRGRISTIETAYPAPKWKGFGPPTLTWSIQPDVQQDIFRLNQQGVLVRLETSRVQSPWLPHMHDGDLLFNVRLKPNSFDVAEVIQRYELKLSQPQTLRGFGQIARDRDFLVNQSYEMVRLPEHHPYDAVALMDTTASIYRDAARLRAVVTVDGEETP